MLDVLVELVVDGNAIVLALEGRIPSVVEAAVIGLAAPLPCQVS